MKNRKWIALLMAMVMALSLAACGSKTESQNDVEMENAENVEMENAESAEGADSLNLTEVMDELLKIGEWPEMMFVEGEELSQFYPDLSDIATKQCQIKTAKMGAAVAEVALVEVENAEDVEAVKNVFQNRIDYQVGTEENPGVAWYPESIEEWTNNTRIVSNGNYVMLVASDVCDDLVEYFNEFFA